MSIANEPTSQKTAMQSFGKRNANRERIQQDEDELKQLLEKNVNPSSEEEKNVTDNDENLSSEEKSFKKRYGDLRRHSQQQQSVLQKQIDQLREQLDSSTKQQMKLPTSEEDLAKWAETYPDVARIVETIAIKKAKEHAAALEERLSAIDEKEKLTARDRAELELTKLHPDFDKIRDTDDFHEWADQQPRWVQQALYDNDTDAYAAARAIDLYKIDRGIAKSKSKKEDNSAAQSIGAKNSKAVPSNSDQDGVIYESQVSKMTSRQYEANIEAIQKAIQTGKFVYDLSGKAR